jgi:hypothetical protein
MNPVHTITPHSFKIIVILTSYSHLGLPSGLFPPGFPTNTLYENLKERHYLTRPGRRWENYIKMDLREMRVRV